MVLQEVSRWCNWKTISNRSVVASVASEVAFCVEYETGVAHTCTQTHTQQRSESKTGRSVTWSGMLSVFPMFPPVHVTPFCQKSTIFLVIYHIFHYKTCTGCLEQQQKYNIQFIICHFFSFNNHQFNRWILLKFISLIVWGPRSQMAWKSPGWVTGYK